MIIEPGQDGNVAAIRSEYLCGGLFFMNEKCDYFMKLALQEAKKAFEENEVPIGCVIVKDDQVISSAHNTREQTQNAINHAEMLAIAAACKKIGSWRLDGCEIYITCEPCPMCSGAIFQSRIKEIYYGASNETYGALNSSFNLFEEIKIDVNVKIYKNILRNECESILSNFFKNKR